MKGIWLLAALALVSAVALSTATGDGSGAAGTLEHLASNATKGETAGQPPVLIGTAPADGGTAVQYDPFIIEIEWASQVTLTKAVLDDEDVLSLAASRDGVIWTIAVPGIGVGSHTPALNATDASGGTLATDVTITFAVVGPPRWDLFLVPGWSLVSVPRDPADTDVNAVLGAAESVDRVVSHDHGLAARVLRADLDLSGCVDQGDLDLLARAMGTAASAAGEGPDLDEDGWVDVRDLSLAGLLFGGGGGARSAPPGP